MTLTEFNSVLIVLNSVGEEPIVYESASEFMENVSSFSEKTDSVFRADPNAGTFINVTAEMAAAWFDRADAYDDCPDMFLAHVGDMQERRKADAEDPTGEHAAADAWRDMRGSV